MPIKTLDLVLSQRYETIVRATLGDSELHFVLFILSKRVIITRKSMWIEYLQMMTDNKKAGLVMEKIGVASDVFSNRKTIEQVFALTNLKVK